MFKLSVLITLCVATVALGGVIPSEGENRIVGGSVAAVGQFPYQVSLRSRDNFHFCGGSIIGVNWVITAGHCTYGQSPSNVFVITGATRITDTNYVYNTQQIIIHEQYNPSQLTNDISLIRVVGQIQLNNLVQIINLSRYATQGNELATASGWGQTSNPGSAAQTLMYLGVTTMDPSSCSASRLCTKSPVGQGLCFGDSGGPLVTSYGLVGLVSTGTPCALGQPDVFTRVSYYNNWIAYYTGIN